MLILNVLVKYSIFVWSMITMEQIIQKTRVIITDQMGEIQDWQFRIIEDGIKNGIYGKAILATFFLIILVQNNLYLKSFKSKN